MSKGERLRGKRNRKSSEEKLDIVGQTKENKLKLNHSYWCTGYYWNHDVILVEPFLVVVGVKCFIIQNLVPSDIEYYTAQQLLRDQGTRYFFEDRVHAIEALEHIENASILMSAYSEFMTDEDLKRVVENV